VRIPRKRLIKIIIGSVLGLLAVYYIIENVDLVLLGQELKQFNPAVYFFPFLFYPMIMFLRAVRWWLILMAEKDVTNSMLTLANSIGFFMNYIIPAKIGEITRAEVVCQKSNLSLGFT